MSESFSLTVKNRRYILEEIKVEPIAIIMGRRLEWFAHVKRRDETENIRADHAEMKMEGKRRIWNDAVRRDIKACKIREEWATDRE